MLVTVNANYVTTVISKDRDLSICSKHIVTKTYSKRETEVNTAKELQLKGPILVFISEQRTEKGGYQDRFQVANRVYLMAETDLVDAKGKNEHVTDEHSDLKGVPEAVSNTTVVEDRLGLTFPFFKGLVLGTGKDFSQKDKVVRTHFIISHSVKLITLTERKTFSV